MPNQPNIPKPAMPVQPFTELQALRMIGWWAGVDSLLLGMIIFIAITGVYWKVFGNPAPLPFLWLTLAVLIILQIWVIVLLYRIATFVLRCHADLKNMGPEAARLAVAFMSGDGSK